MLRNIFEESKFDRVNIKPQKVAIEYMVSYESEKKCLKVT